MNAANNRQAIGVFDSGVGGLTVVRELMRHMPNEEIIYFGDTARVPYGSKSKETVTKYAKQIVRFLLSKNVKAVIIACNTVSSNSYQELTETFDIPMIEMVSHGVGMCLEATANNTIGVIGTEGTIRSRAYEQMILAQRPGAEVFAKACPLFVPLAEEGWTSNTVAQLTAEIYLQELIDRKIDSLILGCTHYPLLLDCIRRAVGGIHIVNPAEAAAAYVSRFLRENDAERTCTTAPQHTFYVSDNTQKFDRICRVVLGSSYPAETMNL